MKALNISLMFNGNTETVFNFYKTVFGGEFSNLQRMKDIPHDIELADDQKEKILYISLPLAGATLAGMDVPQHIPPAIMGSNFTISLDMEREDETTRIFNALSIKGQIRIPLGPQFYATYFGMVTDQYGITWMLSYNK